MRESKEKKGKRERKNKSNSVSSLEDVCQHSFKHAFNRQVLEKLSKLKVQQDMHVKRKEAVLENWDSF